MRVARSGRGPARGGPAPPKRATGRLRRKRCQAARQALDAALQIAHLELDLDCLLELIARNWDDLLRLAGSLEMSTVGALVGHA